MNVIYHFPPDLFHLLIKTIPLLCKSKTDVLNFFKGAGISTYLMRDIINQVNIDRHSISKYEITRLILERINEKGESSLRERRELLKRVTQFENFEACWENDRLPAKGLVAEINKLVKVKDSFTRMEKEREREAKEKREAYLNKTRENALFRKEIEDIKAQLNSLFLYKNPQERGKKLESILNRLFKTYGILISEAFERKGEIGEGIIEQIDGVIDIEGELYLVEMKWWNKPMGPGEVSQHLVRVFNRGHSRGIFISNSPFTPAAVDMCKDSLSKTTMCLCGLDEIIFALENDQDLKKLLKKKIQTAIVQKNPYKTFFEKDLKQQ